MKPLTIKSLTAEIARSEQEFAVSHKSAVAERIARLHNFKSHLAAKRYATGTHDWIGPEDFARLQSPKIL